MKTDRKQIRYSLQLLLHLQKNKVTKDQDGYAMLITSILAILMFSMLSVYLFSANLYKSVANAVVDSGSTFYAAESGMNKRANLVKTTFDGFSQPAGVSPNGADVALQMQNCINNNRNAAGAIVADNTTTVGTLDFRCQEAEFDYKESAWKGGGDNSFTERYDNNPNVKYRAYSFVRKITPDGEPAITRIPAGEEYAGLNMQEYKYRVYTTSIKKSGGYQPVSAQTLLQMDFNSRLVPLFQFAAFYEQDLEITSYSHMSLNGPIHSNSNVYFAPGGNLSAGSTTAARKKDASGAWIGGKIYKSLNRIPNYSYQDPGRSVTLGNNTPISVVGAWSTANTQVDSGEISSSSGLLNPDSTRLEIPPVGLLSTTGTYYDKADLRVSFDPNTTAQPFGVQSIQRDTATTTTFSAAMVKSLQQPVMLVTQAHQSDNKSNEWNKFCSNAKNLSSTTATTTANFTSDNFNNTWNATPTAEDLIANEALRRAIAKSTLSATPYTLTALNGSVMNSLPDTLFTRFKAELVVLGTSLNGTQQDTTYGGITPRAIANKANGCFLPPPIQVLRNQLDRQENRRPMQILQSNIHSLTIWNRDGKYSDDGTNVLDAVNKIFDRATASGSATGSYEWMGLAASDRTQRGLVWHFSVKNDGTYPSAYPTANPRVSNYGFGFSGGRWLPGPLSLATDQIAYIQGDYNNPGGLQPAFPISNPAEDIFDSKNADGTTKSDGAVRDANLLEKKPAAVMADAIGILSNKCVGSNGELNCFNVSNGVAIPRASNTSVNAAFLAGTTPQSGLNNYIRMMEDWYRPGNGAIFRYRGSFVSLGIPQKMSGTFQPGTTGVASSTSYFDIPTRDFGYDTSFNNAAGLPPLSPQAVYLKQKVFRRDYNSDRTN